MDKTAEEGDNMTTYSLVLQLCSSVVLLGLGIYLLSSAYRIWKNQKNPAT